MLARFMKVNKYIVKYLRSCHYTEQVKMQLNDNLRGKLLFIYFLESKTYNIIYSKVERWGTLPCQFALLI